MYTTITMSTNKTYNAQCRIDEKQATALKNIAEERQVTVSVVVRWALNDYLDKNRA